ncbi:integrase family protein [Segniliparus rotundus DSM 44985]|uniref:Integrase family protein n=1 Tax=Segniliparus rotundus (strain ATCC BAA-972 / CDC 1076 / CIP 108378 / DSM 44985 / JCM 13578) TaxID=640132 RepID=D6ZE80_SEGRD|nr:tyrosine-type recombinase/integrase [Segniliparus rotundus]ADG97360.1 integrase family protein [Segniliparus rotundus DSM 44985]
MATVEPYTTSLGEKLWLVRYRKPDRKQTTKRGFTTKRDANAFANEVEVKKATGSYIAPALGRVTVSSVAEGWLTHKEATLKPSAWRPVESAWRARVEPEWGAVRISDVEQVDVERWIARLRTQNLSATSVLRAHQTLAGVLDLAVKSRRLASNPARGIDGLPRKVRKPRTYFSTDQLHSLADESKGHRTLVLLLGTMGPRWGETVGLQVGDCDFLRRRVHIRRNAVQLGGGQIVVGTPKGHEDRWVPIPPFLLDDLARQCEGKKRDDLVFPARGGGFLKRPYAESGWFDGALRRAGLPRVTPHDLRHTAASIAVSNGANILALARMLGHDPAMTLKVYADLFDADLDAVAEAVSAAMTREKCAQNVLKGA